MQSSDQARYGKCDLKSGLPLSESLSALEKQQSTSEQNTAPCASLSTQERHEGFAIQQPPVIQNHIGFFADETFSLPNAAQIILAEIPTKKHSRREALPANLPSYTARLWSVSLLGREEEYHLFRKWHYLKFLASELQNELHSCRGSAGLIPQLDEQLEAANRVRNQLVESNLRLVVSIAKKFSKKSFLTFDELVSSGNTVLIAAAESFDYRRGFRFSTYAYRAIQRGMYGLLKSESKKRERIFSNGDSAIRKATGDAAEADVIEIAVSTNRANAHRLLQLLLPRERQIVVARLGIEQGKEPCSYQEIGKSFGLSKQRIRQIFCDSISKLRRHIDSGDFRFSDA